MRNARKKIEATQVEDLAFIGSTMSEMATFLNCSEYTLYRRFHKVIMRAIVCRTIFLKRQRFELALKGNVAALKFWDAGVDETNKQLKDLKRHEEEASLTHEEQTARILDSVKCMREFWDKYPEMKKSIGPSAAA